MSIDISLFINRQFKFLYMQTFFNPLGTIKGAPYPVGTILFESGIAGTYSITTYEGIYELQICGAGGGGGGSAGSHAWYGQNGGAGSAWKGYIKLNYATYTLIIGQGGGGGAGSGRNALPGANGTASYVALSGNRLITTGAGNGGAGTGNYAGANNGAGGILTMGSLNILTTLLSSNGITQSTTSLLNNGYGAGGAYRPANTGLNGTNGYIKLTYLRLRPN